MISCLNEAHENLLKSTTKPTIHFKIVKPKLISKPKAKNYISIAHHSLVNTTIKYMQETSKSTGSLFLIKNLGFDGVFFWVLILLGFFVSFLISPYFGL